MNDSSSTLVGVRAATNQYSKTISALIIPILFSNVKYIMKGMVLLKNKLLTKEVDFQGSTIMCFQDNSTGKVYVGVSWICSGIGLTEKQKDRQVANIQSDFVLSEACLKLPLKFEGQVRNALSIELEYLPLWLAKISITPKMLSKTPEIANRLKVYQLKAKDVLAEAFIKPREINFNKF